MERRENIKTDIKDILTIIRTDFKNLYLTKLENLVELDNFLDIYHPGKLNQYQLSNLNRSIVPSEVDAVIKIS